MNIALKRIGQPSGEPLTLRDIKDHLRVDDTFDDDYITGLTSAARERVEDFTSRCVVPQQWMFALDSFPRAPYLVERSLTVPLFHSLWWDQQNVIVLPRGPVVTVDAITYTDNDGQSRTLDPSLYQVDTFSEPGRIAPAFGTSWPVIQPTLNAVQVTFTAGYEAVPQTFLQAIRLMVASWYENREDVTVGAGNAQTLPRSAEAILSRYRLFRTGYQVTR